MLQSPAAYPSQVQDIYNGNPWSQNDDDMSPTKSPEAEDTTQSATEPRPMGCHTRSYTTGHPLYTPDGDDDTDEHYGELTRRASLDSVGSRRSRRRHSSGKGTNGRASIEGDSQVEQKEVIVHEVKPTDSLAGVALKYNVTLATIRSANKLWANDSIHLRRVLYIPLEAVSSHQSQFATPSFHPSHAALEMRNLTNVPAIHKRGSRGSDWEAIRDEGYETHTRSPSDAPTIRRIPLSELSFFPPSANGGSTSNVTSSLSSSPTAKQETAAIVPSLPRNPLATLFNGAKEEIMHRLSFDSTREPSEAGEDEAHELREVCRDRRSRSYSSGTTRPVRLSELFEPTSATLDPPITPPKIVRTVQLQPSPNMVIPRTSTYIERT